MGPQWACLCWQQQSPYQLSAMPAGDTISGHEGRRSIFTGYCTQISNPLSQHPAVTRGTDQMQHCTPMDRTALRGTQTSLLLAYLSKDREIFRKVN